MVKNHFDQGPEGWCSYDYHASIVAGGTNIFILATWEAKGGVGGSGYVWTDHRRWSADTPEEPLSILPFLFYRRWIGEDPLDLRQTEVSIYLRGDDLQLDGARCLFWIHGHSTRWHCTRQPLAIAEGRWPVEPCRLTLRSDEADWHRSWSLDRQNPAPLGQVLGRAESYGISFVGFSSEVRGRLSMDEFEIRRLP